MKLSLIVIITLTQLSSLIAEPSEKVTSNSLLKPEVRLKVTHPFRIFLTEEILLTHNTGKHSSVSHWTAQIKSKGNFDRKYEDRFKARVLTNGFLEITNGADILMIPMDKVKAIKMQSDKKLAEQVAAPDGE